MPDAHAAATAPIGAAPSAEPPLAAPEPSAAMDDFDMQLGLDMVCGSLNVLSALLGEAERAPVKNTDLGYLMWLIEEKADAVRAAFRSKIEDEGVQLRQVLAAAGLARKA